MTNDNHVDPELSANSIAAFRLLKSYQDVGHVLVAKTSRLLRYNLARDYLAFTESELDGQTVLEFTAIKDTQFGQVTPTIAPKFRKIKSNGTQRTRAENKA